MTSKARNKIRQELNEEEFKKASQGRELLGRRLKNWKLEFPDEYVTELLKKLKFSSLNSFYAAVSDGTVTLDFIKNYILDHASMVRENIEQAKAEFAASGTKNWEDSHSSDDILVINARDLKGLDYKMAKCCHPIFGDDVFGFVTRTEGIKIHRISCPNASRLLSLYPYRIQKVRWAETPSGGSFQASLRIVSSNDSLVINKIMDIVNVFKASIRSFNVNENQRNGTYEILLKISVPSNTELDKVVSQIRLIRGISKVSRN